MALAIAEFREEAVEHLATVTLALKVKSKLFRSRVKCFDHVAVCPTK
jgi:hypothetical protein